MGGNMARQITGLPSNAYTPLKEGEKYIPYVPPSEQPPEFTTRSVFWGLVMSFVFTAAAAYLGLKIGQVFEAAIPIAILAVGIANLYKRKSSILENVIIQSIGAASGLIVAGTIFTIPGLYILNLNVNFLHIFIAAIIGACFGLFFLIPMRKYFVAEQHGLLPFPEATATTEVLIAGEAGAGQAKILLQAALLGGIYDFCIATFGLWREVVSTRVIPLFAQIADKLKIVIKLNAGAAVMGLGYIVGLRYALIIACGSFVSFLVLIPAIWYFGQHFPVIIPPANIPISQMTIEQIFSNYVRHIGIGGIAAAGIIGIIKYSKIIVQAFSLGIKEIFGGARDSTISAERTQRDLPMPTIVLAIAITAVVTLLFFRGMIVDNWTLAIAALLVVFIIAFLFSTVAAQAIAIVGVNPVSGMTLMTLILASVILIQLGLRGPAGMVSALIIGSVVCTALSMSGGFITDLKIGYWLGATPAAQERSKLMGSLVAALAIGGVILLLSKVYGFVQTPEHPNPLAAPQANAMAAVLSAIMGKGAPWLLYVAGIFMAIIINFLGISPLAFALGMYLPIELNTPVLVGGIISHLVIKSSKDPEVSKARKDKGTLIASGFVAGGAIMGVISALLSLIFRERLQTGIAHKPVGEILSIILFIGLCVFMYYFAKSAAKEKNK
ncbi:oligopeptide transporter, OPT family [candidate division KSB1 bacterium]|nr:MAG: oligopeptide transporter, OPT family [candidate division KSB1 bacterium]RKY85483.1 MAG: oligopeptide transporter, OPT family [candidate division KSB1 bacterium]